MWHVVVVSPVPTVRVLAEPRSRPMHERDNCMECATRYRESTINWDRCCGESAAKTAVVVCSCLFAQTGNGTEQQENTIVENRTPPHTRARSLPAINNTHTHSIHPRVPSSPLCSVDGLWPNGARAPVRRLGAGLFLEDLDLWLHAADSWWVIRIFLDPRYTPDPGMWYRNRCVCVFFLVWCAELAMLEAPSLLEDV